MKDTLERKKIKDLLAVESFPCISLYLPTHEKGGETKEDRIRFKNLLRTCEKRLKECGFKGDQLTDVLQPAWDLLGASVAWRYLDRGLAVFISSEVFRAFTLPFACPEQVWVETHFYIKPLAPLWGPDQRFHILALSRGQAKLYDADDQTIGERPLPDAPESLNDFLKYDEGQEHLQYHTAPSGKSAGTDAMFHGHGNVADEAQRKRSVDEYVKAVRNAVEKQLAGHNRPLALIASEYVQSVYREVSHYRHLLTTGATQGPDRLSDTELHEVAQDVVRPYLKQQMHDRLAHYQDLLNHGHASDRMEEIVPAAKQGRVDTLLLDPNACVWGDGGTTDSGGPTQSPEDRKELLDVAVRDTLARGGNVYAVAQQDLPSQSPAGAILRY